MSFSERISRVRLLGILAVVLAVSPVSVSRADYYVGIDVSKWQGSINWTSVRNSGIDFAFIKASEGVGYVDPYFTTNITGARDAGILAGAYHFATPYTNGVDDSITEANSFVSAVSGYLGDDNLRPVLDVEARGDLGSTVLSNWVNSFAGRFKALTGVDIIIYCNTNYASNYLNSTVTDKDLWIANWKSSPTGSPGTGVWNDWDFWQWSSTQSVPGISGNVDADVCRDPWAYTIGYSVPEPSTWMLLLTAAAAWFGLYRVFRLKAA